MCQEAQNGTSSRSVAASRAGRVWCHACTTGAGPRHSPTATDRAVPDDVLRMQTFTEIDRLRRWGRHVTSQRHGARRVSLAHGSGPDGAGGGGGGGASALCRASGTPGELGWAGDAGRARDAERGPRTTRLEGSAASMGQGSGRRRGTSGCGGGGGRRAGLHATRRGAAGIPTVEAQARRRTTRSSGPAGACASAGAGEGAGGGGGGQARPRPRASCARGL